MNKEELSRYYYLSLEIEELKKRIDTLRETAVSFSQITGMPKNKSKENTEENKRIRILALAEKMAKKVSEATEEMLKIEEYISTIEDTELKLILTKRYLESKSWDRVAEELHMSERSVYRKHQEFFKYRTQIYDKKLL